MKKLMMTMLLAIVCMVAGAQNAETLYQEGKALYDASKFDQAFPKLKASADKGHKKAQYRVGKCYKEGWGVAEDDKKAAEYFTKAAKQDNAKAQYQLAKAYMKGKGVAKDEKKAKSWLKKAVTHPKKGAEIMEDLRKDAADGKTAQRMLQMVEK